MRDRFVILLKMSLGGVVKHGAEKIIRFTCMTDKAVLASQLKQAATCLAYAFGDTDIDPVVFYESFKDRSIHVHVPIPIGVNLIAADYDRALNEKLSIRRTSLSGDHTVQDDGIALKAGTGDVHTSVNQ